MAQTSHPGSSENVVLESQIRECFGRVVYTHKTHEKQADICAGTLRRFKIWQIILSAVTSTGAIAVIVGDEQWVKIATAIVSVIALIITGYMKGFDPGATAQKHRDTASLLWGIRESYLSLLTDIGSNRISEDLAAERRDNLQSALEAIYKSAPHTTPKAYISAQNALQALEDYSFKDGEIDAFLPPPLKRTITVANAQKDN